MGKTKKTKVVVKKSEEKYRFDKRMIKAKCIKEPSFSTNLNKLREVEEGPHRNIRKSRKKHKLIQKKSLTCIQMESKFFILK